MELDPLTNVKGKKIQIGEYIRINSTPDRYHFVVYRGVPPKALKILCKKVKQHIKGLPRTAHIELFKEVGSQYKIVLSAERLKNISIPQLAIIIVEQLKKKKRGHYVHLVLLQTVSGGHLMNYDGI